MPASGIPRCSPGRWGFQIPWQKAFLAVKTMIPVPLCGTFSVWRRKVTMETNVIHVDPDQPETLAPAGALIRNGQLVAFPTETVYGLGANALDGKAVREIYRAKGRPSDNPLIVHIADLSMAIGLVRETPPLFFTLAAAFWPGPLTLILPKAPHVPPETTGGLNTVAIRMPANAIALALIRAAGVPIAAPSSNLSGKPSPTKAQHVFHDLNGRIPLILDGGAVEIGLESTVLDLSRSVPVILRPGKITAADLAPYIPEIEESPDTIPAEKKPKAPGMKYTHYAPDGKLYVIPFGEIASFGPRFQAGEGKKALLLSTEGWDEICNRVQPDLLLLLGARADLDAVGHNLFSALRECDRQKMDTIYIEAFPSGGMGAALMNRIEKASHKE